MTAFGDGTSRQELVQVIRQVRSRWRTRMLLRGGVIVLVGAFLALVLASFGLQSYKFSPGAVIGFRIAIFATFAALLGLWLVRPLGRRVSDLQVALYVEEHEPSLQAAILSAVDIGAASDAGTVDIPPVIVDKLVAQAIERARTIDGGRTVGRQAMKRQVVALGVLAGVAALLLTVGPEFLRQGAAALLTLTPAEAASPYAIKVTPGDVTIPKGSDQSVSAKLAGFRSNDVALMVRNDGEEKFNRMPLVVTGDAATFEGMLFDVKASMSYYIEADGVRSPTYSMKVVELPAVASLEMELVFPAYTGLPPQKIEAGGDVAALAGTEVRIRATSTMATPAGRIQLDPGKPSVIAAQPDGVLTGSFKIAQDGYYHIELDGPRGENVTASPKYTIDALEDQPPTVTFEKPRRDTTANPVEEVFVQARAQDDYGVRQLDLVYSVNGGPEKTVAMYGRGAKPLAEVSAGQTIYMEELGVKAGDSVAYYAKAHDNDGVKGSKTTSSDMYFITIRPFSQNFREAQSQGGGGGGGGGGGRQGAGALSEQQRQVISATFNVERDKGKNPATKVKEDTVFVHLAQTKLREEVEELLQEMRQRLGAGGGENLQRIAEVLPKAVQEMRAAEEQLKNQKTKDALGPEQRALKHLQDAEQAYELEVRRQQGGGGGGGGGGQQMSSELADLFQLQLDRMANQYEQQQRQSQQSQQQQIDELAERLRELARRQLQQAEQQRRQRGQQGSGNGSAQRALAEEMEEAARQLEQLRREAERQGQQRQDLADAARRLQESANAARQAAANGNDGGASAQRAAQSLQDANRRLQENQSQQSGQNVKDLQRQAEDLARQQRELAKQVAGLDGAGDARDARMKELQQQKGDMKEKVADIEQQLGNLSRQALANSQRDSARKLQEASGQIRDQMLKEKIEYSKSAMTGGAEYSKPIENDITSNLDTLSRKIGDAAAAAEKAQQGAGLNRSVENMRNVARGLESLNQQMQGQQGGGQQGQGQEGGKQGEGEKGQGQGQGEKGAKGEGQGQGQGEKGAKGEGQGQGQGQGQGEKGGKGEGQGQGQGGGQGQGEKGGKGEGQGQGRDGQQRGNARLGDNPREGGFTGTPAGPGQSGGDARVGMNSGDVRQWANQARELANDTQTLRNDLQRSGVNAKELVPVDEVVKALRALGDERNSKDMGNLQELYSNALDRFKALEFELRKRTDTSNAQLYLSGSEDVPPNFRSLIQDYYRALSKTPGDKKPGGK